VDILFLVSGMEVTQRDVRVVEKILQQSPESGWPSNFRLNAKHHDSRQHPFSPQCNTSRYSSTSIFASMQNITIFVNNNFCLNSKHHDIHPLNHEHQTEMCGRFVEYQSTRRPVDPSTVSAVKEVRPFWNGVVGSWCVELVS